MNKVRDRAPLILAGLLLLGVAVLWPISYFRAFGMFAIVPGGTAQAVVCYRGRLGFVFTNLRFSDDCGMQFVSLPTSELRHLIGDYWGGCGPQPKRLDFSWRARGAGDSLIEGRVFRFLVARGQG